MSLLSRMKFIWQINANVWVHFWRDDCLYRASALTFTCLLALVPLLSLSFSILTILPGFEKAIKPIQDFIFEHFVPTTGEVIQTHIVNFIEQSARLSLWEVMFFSTFALLTLYTVERAFNQIWRVPHHRNSAWAFLMYWTVLVCTPIFLAMSFLMSSYLFSIPFLQALSEEWVVTSSWLFNLLPTLLIWLGLTLLYVVVPNCRVQFTHGIIGALVATILIEIAKKLFIYYFQYFHGYELIYGAFAAIPIFFIWLYWLWVFILYGALIVYVLGIKKTHK